MILRVQKLLFALALSTLSCAMAHGNEAEYPRKPVKVVVPFSPGGTSDTLARILQQAVPEDRVTLAIINVPGAGGTIGSYRVKNARPDGYTILNLHEGILTAKYSGKSTYGPQAFVPIAATSSSGTVICVREESPFKNLSELLDEAEEHPDTIRFGGNTGAPTHFVGLQLEAQRPGATFRFVAAGGGAKRFAALAGGHLEFTMFSKAEFLQFRESGLRALAYLGAERDPDLPDVPTGIEQGIEVVATVTQFWWAPKGTPPERVAYLADALEAAVEDPDLLKAYEALSEKVVFLRGEALSRYLDETERRIAEAAIIKEVESVPLDYLVVVLTGVLGLLFLLVERKGHARKRVEISLARPTGVGVLLILYTMMLFLRLMPFWAVTWIFAGALGVLIAKRGKQRAIVVLVALVLGLGLQVLFQEILVIDLPG